MKKHIYLYILVTNICAVGTAADWDSLIKALNVADVNTVKSIVPSKIGPEEKTKSGRSVLKIAEFQYKNSKQIYDYLNSLIAAPSAAPAAQVPAEILFYDKNKPYYEFTNFYPAAINLDGKIWPTTEHYFQAQKFPGNNQLQENIRAAKTAREAFDIARANNNLKRQDWESVKDGIMEKALDAKFTQHENLKKLLLSTGNSTLIEDSPVDEYWGWGKNKTGLNMLGILLGDVRSIIRSKQSK